MRKVTGVFLAVCLGVGGCDILVAQQRETVPEFWVGSWASAQQIPEPENTLHPEDLRDATLRQIVHLSAGGVRVRLRLSNVFGVRPLAIDSVRVANASQSAPGSIDPLSDKAVTFFQSTSVTIPAGAEYLSDPVEMSVKPRSEIAVTMHLTEPPAQQTGHPGSRQTSFLVHGNFVSAAALPDAKLIDHWYFLSGVDVASALPGRAIVAFGDSITDGHGSTTNGNDRWPDLLAEQLEKKRTGAAIGVLNLGIGGNHLLTDGLGPNALARFDRDVLAEAGVKTVVVLEGVNDLGALALAHDVTAKQHDALIASVEAAYEQIILRAHAHGLKVIGGTILPYVGSDYYHPGEVNELDRARVNAWIRAKGHFDAVVDFDKVIADPKHPERLLPAYDCGDHLHPSPVGYKAMAAAVAKLF